MANRKSSAPGLLLILTVTMICSTYNYGQMSNGMFEHLTLEDGISHSLVFNLTQDSTGFIWAATQDGLNRYDGYEFLVYRNNNPSNTVPDNWITSIITDTSGNIWYGTRSQGIGKIIKSTGEFINYSDTLRNRYGEDGLKIQNIFLAKDNTLWIATWGSGIINFDPVTLNSRQYIHDDNNEASISEDRIYSIYEDSKGIIWAGAHRTGLNSFDPSTNRFSHVELFLKNKAGNPSLYVTTIAEDAMNNLWVGTYGNGLYRINSKNEEIEKFGAKNQFNDTLITKIFRDTQNDVWICTDGGGIYKYESEANSFINFRYSPMNRRSLNSNKVWSVIEDKTGVLWFGTSSGGLNIYNRVKNQIEHYYHDITDNNSIIDDFVKAIFRDSKNNLWIGTNSGITVNWHDGSVKHFTVKNGLSNNRVRKFYEDREGKIWISTWGGGVAIYNPKSNTFKIILNNPDNENSIADNFTREILEIPGVGMYIGTERGLSFLDLKNNKFTNYTTIENDPTSISNLQISVCLFDSKGRFWVGTQYGLNLFDYTKGRFMRFDSEDASLKPSSYRISEIYEDSRGTIWFGTFGGGLNRYNDDGSFTVFTEEQGLSNNLIYEILEDESGRLWISTNAGINIFNPGDSSIQVLTYRDGLQGNEFNGGASFKDSDGKLYFGGVNGYNCFYPSSLIQKETKPTLAITKISVNGIEYIGNPILGPNELLQLHHKENFLDFSFAALDFNNSKENRFRYMLEGVNEDWIDAGTNHKAIFTNLDPGTYTFKLTGSNNAGYWNNDAINFKIAIDPPWWGTNYFKSILFLIIILVIYLVYSLRIKSIRSREKLLKELVNSRTNDLLKSKELLEEAVKTKDKLFSIIAHDLRNPFVPLLGYSEMLASNSTIMSKAELKETSQNIYNSSRSMFGLLQNLLDWARLQLDNIEYKPECIDLNSTVQDVFNIYSTSAAMKSIKLINLLPEKSMVFADENMLQTVLRNFISNSIKYSLHEGFVKISLVEKKNNFEVEIADNGIGMDEETLGNLNSNSKRPVSKLGTSKEKGTGIGVMLAREFIEINKGTLNITSKINSGTSAKISLPKCVNN